MWICETLARCGCEFGEFTASHRLVHSQPRPTRTFILLVRLVAVSQIRVGLPAHLATLLEVAWEISEKTDAVIQHYREATIALDYFGDSVLNPVADCCAMVVGCFLASFLPIWASIAAFIIAEVFVLYFIRDGLLLNILMLLWPLEAVKMWQRSS